MENPRKISWNFERIRFPHPILSKLSKRKKENENLPFSINYELLKFILDEKNEKLYNKKKLNL